jgi:hypothetical protein
MWRVVQDQTAIGYGKTHPLETMRQEAWVSGRFAFAIPPDWAMIDLWPRPIPRTEACRGRDRGEPKMTERSRLLPLLERAAEHLGIPVRYAEVATDELTGRGGLCVVRGERRLIIERSLSDREKARLLAHGLAQLEVDAIYLPPAVREAIEEARSETGRAIPGRAWSDGDTGNPPAAEKDRTSETLDR